MGTERWSDVREVGFLRGMRLLFWVYRVGGYHAFRAVLQPVLLYSFFTHKLSRTASLDYLRRLRQYFGSDAMPPATWWTAYRHFNAFAGSTLDRLGAWSNSSILDRINFPERDLLLKQLDSGQGAVLLGAHLGNMEVLRGLSTRNRRLTLNILVHTRNADMFNRLLRDVVGERDVTLIEVTEMSPATAIRLKGCIDRGEFIAILADRVPVSSESRTRMIPFLGAPARFPDGPFILASLLKCPVYTLFSTRQGKGYDIRCQKLANSVKLPRRGREEAITAYMQRYVQELEINVQRAPLQWFNFYPFWDQK